MSTRTAKQIIYGTLYGLIWLAIFAGIYYAFVKPAITPPACTGPLCGIGAAQPLATSTVYTFTTSPGSATYLAEVTNDDSDLGATAIDYSFDFYDASGTLLQSIPGSSFIYPNQVKYLLVPNEAPISASSISLDIHDATWAASSTMGTTPQFTFQNIGTQTGSTTVSVSGQITNNDIASFDQVLIIVVFKDGSGNPLGASQTELDNFAPNTTQNFSVIYPAVPGINPANNEIVAYALRESM